MKGYRDKTSEAAIGSADREWHEMTKIALKIRKHQCNYDWGQQQEKRFIGIFKRLLTDPIEELEKQLRR